MAVPPEQHHLQAGEEALSRAAWREARAAFGAALARGESPEALEGLGLAAWWLDEGATALDARERAYRLYRRRGDPRSAARLATELAEDYVYFRGEPAIANGWVSRAHRLLDGCALSPEHGWLRLIEGDLAMSVANDPAAARAHAVAAQHIARQLDLIDLEMLAVALEGLALVTAGRLTEGMPRLDEAAAAAVSGEMADPLAIGFTCCYLITACERARDYQRAAQWCVRVNAFCDRTQFSTLFAICRIQYASVRLWRGEWQAAEAELRTAIQALAASHPAMQPEGFVRVAELRLRQGRLDEVSELLHRAEGHPRAVLGRAVLALERGEAEGAVQLAQRFLRGVAPENRSERLLGLDLLVRAQIARGDLVAAAGVNAELQRVAAEVSTDALRAAARAAEGLLAAAADDHAAACPAFEDAADLYDRSGAPFEKARATLDLAGSLAALGRHEAAEAEARAARDVFVRLGAGAEARRAQAVLRGLSGGRRGGSALTRRELEVLRLLAEGLSNQKIASRLRVSQFTIKRHVANILTKLHVPSRAAAAAYAARRGVL